MPVHCSQWHYPAFFAVSPASTVHLLTVLQGRVWGHHAPKHSALIYKLIWLKSVTQTARIILWATIRWTVQALGLYIFTGIFWCVNLLFSIFWHHHWIPGGQFTYVAYALREGVHCFGYMLGNVEYRVHQSFSHSVSNYQAIGLWSWFDILMQDQIYIP